MKHSAGNIKLTAYEDLFEAGVDGGTGSEKVRDVPLAELFPFEGHPFKVLDDSAMWETVESIRKNGVLVPGIVRPRPGGGYEMVAGHRRRRASELAGRDTMPVLVREMDDDEAILAMVDSNLQREDLLPSEKAWAYKMKLDAIRRRAGRPAKGNSGQAGQNYGGKFSVEIVAENAGESSKQVQRYIRLTELTPALLEMVDSGKLPFSPAVELSYLADTEQAELLGVMGEAGTAPSMEQAKQMKRLSQEGKLDREALKAIMLGRSPAPSQVTLKGSRLRMYFPPAYTRRQMEEIIFSLLESWKKENA